jgi:hypothetical protein
MSEILDMKKAQERLGVSRASAYRILAKEPGVQRFYVPGSKKPIIRVDSSIIDRILKRTAIRA